VTVCWQTTAVTSRGENMRLGSVLLLLALVARPALPVEDAGGQVEDGGGQVEDGGGQTAEDDEEGVVIEEDDYIRVGDILYRTEWKPRDCVGRLSTYQIKLI
jgi:hypothetical protein